jgi:hypothetical protein
MLKWLAVLSLAGMTILTSAHCQNQKDNKQHESQQIPSPVVTIVNNSESRNEADSRTQESPESHTGIKWSEWVLSITGIITAVAVWKQAHDTRIAAEATQESVKISGKALVAQFRPKVVVRSLTLTPSSVAEFDHKGIGVWEIEAAIVNKGDTPANVTMCSMEVFWERHFPDISRVAIESSEWNTFSIDPGEVYKLVLPIKWAEFRISMTVLERVAKDGDPQYEFPVCFGHVLYTDDNGHKRETAWHRKWEIANRRFIPSIDNEEEYCD